MLEPSGLVAICITGQQGHGHLFSVEGKQKPCEGFRLVRGHQIGTQGKEQGNLQDGVWVTVSNHLSPP